MIINGSHFKPIVFPLQSVGHVDVPMSVSASIIGVEANKPCLFLNKTTVALEHASFNSTKCTKSGSVWLRRQLRPWSMHVLQADWITALLYFMISLMFCAIHVGCSEYRMLLLGLSLCLENRITSNLPWRSCTVYTYRQELNGNTKFPCWLTTL